MKRIFVRDVLECPSCRGLMRVIAAIEQPETVAAIVGSLGLASRASPAAPARQGELFCDPDFERAGLVDDFTGPPSD